MRTSFYSSEYSIDKTINEYLVLNVIRETGPLSITDIVRRTKLSRPTVETFLNHLLNIDFIVKDGYGQSKGGRKPTLWKLNKDVCYFIGVDIEPPLINVVLTDLELNIINFLTREFQTTANKEVITQRIIETIHDVINASEVEHKKIIGIGIGIPGVIDLQKGISLFIEGVPNWNNVPIKSIIHNEFDLPVFIENVVVNMAIAERTFNEELKNINNMIYIGPGTGVGAAIFINGKPYDGVTGNAGHLGQLPVGKKSPLNSENGISFLQLLSDKYAIMNKVQEENKELRSAEGIKEKISNKDLHDITTVLQEANEGNETIRNVLKEIADYYAYGIATLVNLLDIPTIVIGGIIANLDQYFLDWVSDICINKYCHQYRKSIDLRFGRIIDKVAPLGGAVLVYQDMFKEPEINL